MEHRWSRGGAGGAEDRHTFCSRIGSKSTVGTIVIYIQKIKIYKILLTRYYYLAERI